MSPKSFLTTLLAVSPTIIGCSAQTIVPNSQCDYYVTNGTVPTYYKGHIFFDFRSLGQHAGIPPLFTIEKEHANGWVTSPYFEEGSAFNKVWYTLNYNQYNPSNSKIIPLQYSRSNLYIETNSDMNCNSDIYLTMRTARLPGF